MSKLSDSPIFWALMGAVLLGQAVYHLFFSKKAQVRRALKRTPRIPIDQAKDDVVHLTGRVRRVDELLTAPLSGRPCVAFEASITVGSGRSRTRIFAGREARPFWLEDESGRILVEPNQAFQLALVADIEGRESDHPSEAVSANVSRLLRAADIQETTLLGFKRSVHYREAVLEQGERASVHGRAVREAHPDGERPNVDGPRTRLVMRGRDHEPIRMSDDPELGARP